MSYKEKSHKPQTLIRDSSDATTSIDILKSSLGAPAGGFGAISMTKRTRTFLLWVEFKPATPLSIALQNLPAIGMQVFVGAKKKGGGLFVLYLFPCSSSGNLKL
jgi:hypothetical protein